MAILLMFVLVIIAALSLTWHMAVMTHVVLLAPGAALLWWVDVTRRPIVPCKHCDKGRSWDNQHEHFGEFCPGALFGIGSCGGTGKKMRWEARAISILGGGRALRNLPETMRSDDV
jgi:hypothetical protein